MYNLSSRVQLLPPCEGGTRWVGQREHFLQAGNFHQFFSQIFQVEVRSAAGEGVKFPSEVDILQICCRPLAPGFSYYFTWICTSVYLYHLYLRSAAQRLFVLLHLHLHLHHLYLNMRSDTPEAFCTTSPALTLAPTVPGPALEALVQFQLHWLFSLDFLYSCLQAFCTIVCFATGNLPMTHQTISHETPLMCIGIILNPWNFGCIDVINYLVSSINYAGSA